MTTASSAGDLPRHPSAPMLRLLPLVLVSLLGSGCLKNLATGALADALSGGSGLGSDDDPELVRDAAPFGLKTMESVFKEQPQHVGLITSLTSGFAQYAYAFVQQDADADELDGKATAARPKRERAKKLLLRARDYGLRGLELRSPGITEKLKGMKDLDPALAQLKKEDIPLVYWTAAAWALAIANGKEDMGLVSQLPAPEALMTRALALDPDWEKGTLHEFFVSYLPSKPGGSEAKAKEHFDRAQALHGGAHLGMYLSWAEGVLVQQQKREEFTAMLQKVLAYDVNLTPDARLANTIAQRRAKLLLAHLDDLFN